MSNKPDKVLFVSLFPPRVGGLPLQSATLARRLEQEGVPVVRVNAHYAAPSRGVCGKVWKGLRQVLALIAACRSRVREVDRVLVAGCSWWGFMPVAVAILVAQRHRKPVSVLYHGGAAPQFLRLHHWWVQPLLRRADMVAVTSRWLQGVFRNYGIETVVVPPIIECVPVRASRANGRGPTLLSNRYLEPLYDVSTILEAFSVVQAASPRAKLVVAGFGSQQDALQHFATRRGLNVTFVGHVTNEAMAQLLAEADLYISAARVDNLPTSVLEAMHAGAMVIATPVGELPHLMVHGRHGLFFEPGSPESLAKTVLYALANEDLCRRCRRQARQLATSLTWDRVRPYYLNLLGERRSAPGQTGIDGVEVLQ
ncbi:MAG: glycosyltransferase family 4 protein [bacterium]|jgi:glycosyltransferase involved in cell wall biosynthesis|nr:glycosyltransferase family 4 protein [candidate division KSB1 bacterium]MDH7558840.1 glycosyltransferase family 4 protein [bacterium]